MFCDEPDCIREAQKGGKCWAHRKRMQRHGDTTPTKAVLIESAMLLADCDTNNDREYREREAAFLRAAKRYKHSRD